ncbi:outer membrane beta-barrel protein [Cyclobacterium xiamenense]|uniref:outer membrane beta-barrel protein n=1 Tax=Cyclobacterium xiamenense TaxID=1297121 RepID=UPI0012B8928F|nr:outer membrane beta-barrel protein [Cyclobacterium xiamenense]
MEFGLFVSLLNAVDMIKSLFFCFLFFLLGWQSLAQAQQSQVNLGFDAGISLNEFYQQQFPAGFGASIKGLLAAGPTGQWSITGNYLYFPIDSSIPLANGENLSLHVVPVLAGYRLNFKPFFLEPQLGGALFVNRFKNSPDTYSERQVEFAFAVEMGYRLQQVEFSLRYQHAGPSPFHLGLLGIRAAYVLPLGGY